MPQFELAQIYSSFALVVKSHWELARRVTHKHITNNSEIDAEEFQQTEKLLFHALRIATFGIQVAKNGSVVNFSECNPIR